MKLEKLGGRSTLDTIVPRQPADPETVPVPPDEQVGGARSRVVTDNEDGDSYYYDGVDFYEMFGDDRRGADPLFLDMDDEDGPLTPPNFRNVNERGYWWNDEPDIGEPEVLTSDLFWVRDIREGRDQGYWRPSQVDVPLDQLVDGRNPRVVTDVPSGEEYYYDGTDFYVMIGDEQRFGQALREMPGGQQIPDNAQRINGVMYWWENANDIDVLPVNPNVIDALGADFFWNNRTRRWEPVNERASGGSYDFGGGRSIDAEMLVTELGGGRWAIGDVLTTFNGNPGRDSNNFRLYQRDGDGWKILFESEDNLQGGSYQNTTAVDKVFTVKGSENADNYPLLRLEAIYDKSGSDPIATFTFKTGTDLSRPLLP